MFTIIIMTAIAIQKYIAQKISEIDDDLILKQIKNLIDSKSNKVYEFSNEQLMLLEESENQLINKGFVNDLEMDNKVIKWQKDK